MARIRIDKDKCKACFLCVEFCPKKLIKVNGKLNKKGILSIEFDESGECLGCGICAIMCPDCCIEIWK